MLLNGALRRAPPIQNTSTGATVISSAMPAVSFGTGGEFSAMKLSTVNRCIEVLSDSISKLPVFFLDENTRKRISHPLKKLLCIRPNEAMTPSVAKKMIEANRLTRGNGYEWIIRDPRTARPAELIPVPAGLVRPWRDIKGHIWYDVIHPWTGAMMRLTGEDMLHYKAYSHDGLIGISVLRRAAEVIESGRAAQTYDLNFYKNGAQPSGVLQADGDLGGEVEITTTDGQTIMISKKEFVRREWEKLHAGPSNAHRTAILDLGLKYQPISITNQDAQFIERQDIAVQDIARFFGVPLYKLQSGKQAYGSNEQNSIEYVVSTLHPTVTQYEEEDTWKLLPNFEIEAGIEIRRNMMAELKGDNASRGQWYKNMREIGAFSVNDILGLEDMPDVDGGDERYASWNYGPLSKWAELSVQRANKGGKSK